MPLLLAVVAVAQAAVTAPPPPPPQSPCGSTENNAFDFWIGEWDVTNTKDGTPAGHSVIEKLYGNCTIRENWREPGFSGGSLNTYVAQDRHWHQLWTDSSGAWREFVGGLTGGKMVLVWSHPSSKDPVQIVQTRLTYTPNPDGSVRQYSDQSIDGAHWTERYDYTYRHPG